MQAHLMDIAVNPSIDLDGSPEKGVGELDMVASVWDTQLGS